MHRAGVDIGGTFTDAILMDESTGSIHISKVPTTPADLSVGFMNSLKRCLDAGETGLKQVERVFHGTTIATNALLEHKGAKTGLITTKGFRDVLEIGTQLRPKLYDVFQEKPKPVIPRYLRFEVSERIGPHGFVIKPIDFEEAERVIQKLRELSVESIAVCFLFSFLSPQHERKVAEMIAQHMPNTHVSLSSQVCPEFREYPRFSTTAVNAYVAPLVSGYLKTLTQQLIGQGFEGLAYIMQSSGGTYSFENAKQRPVFMIESGPAAGVIAASEIGKESGYTSLISLDMGGTTAKAGLVQSGHPQLVREYEVGGQIHGRLSGTGYPIKAPTIDLAEVGAGGGSIAWIDKGGALRVGPQSAGAEPGPVCYSRGGTQPTVTDANLVLGRIDPDYFLGGEMKVSLDSAREAIQKHVATPLGIDVSEAAAGIIEVNNSNTIRTIRIVSTQRGHDPRNFCLFAFGGAGPLVASEIARELEMNTILVPPMPGTTSAYGLLLTDIRHDLAATYITPLKKLDLDRLNEFFQDLETRGTQILSNEKVSQSRRLLRRSIDMRYVGQAYEINVPAPSGRITSRDIAQLRTKFDAEHNRTYGHSASDEEVEIVSLRLAAIGVLPKPRTKKRSRKRVNPIKGTRQVLFDRKRGFEEAVIYERSLLSAGSRIRGPCIIEQLDSTVLVKQHEIAWIDPHDNIIINRTRRS